MHKLSIQISRDKEKEHEELVKINEKLRVQLEGAKDALSNLEFHHKDYIIKLKREHRKTLSSIDNIYNMTGMEYEDLYTKMGCLKEKYAESSDVIKSLRSNLKSYKDKVRRATDDLTEFMAKYDIIKKNMESLREENHKLEDDISKKNEEISELNEKCKMLAEDKDMMRKDMVNMTKKVEVVVEHDHRLLSQTSIDDSEDQSEELFNCYGGNEKTVQTITCIRKSKAVQTEVSNVDIQKKKSRNSSESFMNLNKQSSKTLKSHMSEAVIKSKFPSKLANSDLIGPPYLSPKHIASHQRNTLWTQNKNRFGSNIDIASPVSNNFVGEGLMLPKLKKSARSNTAQQDMFATFQSHQPNLSEYLPMSPGSKFSAIWDVTNEKNSKLISIYSDSKKPAFVKKVHRDPVTGEKVLKGKGGLKDMIRNATARS